MRPGLDAMNSALPSSHALFARGGRGAIIVVTALSMKESYFGSSFSAAELMQ